MNRIGASSLCSGLKERESTQLLWKMPPAGRYVEAAAAARFSPGNLGSKGAMADRLPYNWKRLG